MASVAGEHPRPLSLAFARQIPPFAAYAASSPGAGEVFPQSESPWHGGKVFGQPQSLSVSKAFTPWGEGAERSEADEG